MISLFRGPGGVVRRVGAELVPLGCALIAGGLFMPLGWVLPVGFAIAAGVLTFLLTWISVSFLLRAVRRRPRLCRVYRVALLLHVVFWSALGIADTGNDRVGAIEPAGVFGWRDAVPFLAGAAHADFALPAHTTMAGWGQKPRRLTMPPFASLGVLGRLGQDVMGRRLDDGAATAPLCRTPDPAVPAEPLGAGALVLRPEDATAGPPVAFVRVDLVTSDRALNAAVATAVADLGFRPEGVLLAATHTHSGPGGYSGVPLSAVIGTDHFDPAVFDAVRDACVKAIRAAHAAARPARMGLVRARDRDAAGVRVLVGNRRQSDAQRIDDRVYALRVDEREGSATIAVLLNYAVHPTLLRRRHLGFHRDIAGALEDALRTVVGGTPEVLYVNGAVGDISAVPVAGAAGAEQARILARRFAAQVFAPAWEASGEALRSRLRLAGARTRRRMATPRIVKGWGSREALLDALYGPVWEGDAGVLAANALALPVNVFCWSLGVTELRVGFAWSGAVGFSVNVERGTGSEPYDVGAFVFETKDEADGALGRFAMRARRPRKSAAPGGTPSPVSASRTRSSSVSPAAPRPTSPPRPSSTRTVTRPRPRSSVPPRRRT